MTYSSQAQKSRACPKHTHQDEWHLMQYLKKIKMNAKKKSWPTKSELVIFPFASDPNMAQYGDWSYLSWNVIFSSSRILAFILSCSNIALKYYLSWWLHFGVHLELCTWHGHFSRLTWVLVEVRRILYSIQPCGGWVLLEFTTATKGIYDHACKR